MHPPLAKVAEEKRLVVPACNSYPARDWRYTPAMRAFVFAAEIHPSVNAFA
jgi:hypothetical protein